MKNWVVGENKATSIEICNAEVWWGSEPDHWVYTYEKILFTIIILEKPQNNFCFLKRFTKTVEWSGLQSLTVIKEVFIPIFQTTCLKKSPNLHTA